MKHMYTHANISLLFIVLTNNRKLYAFFNEIMKGGNYMRKVVKNVVAVIVVIALLFGSWGITEMLFKIIGV